MKIITLLCAAIMVAGGAFAQTDTTSKRESDTIRIGNIIIIKKKKSATDSDSDSDRGTTVIKRDRKPSKTSTNWWILDLGFANVKDETVYNSPEANAYLKFPPGTAFTKDDLDLNTGKSSNVNLWFFMQRLNLTKGYLNLKYGLGLEMFNYRYETNISYNKSPAFIFRDSISFSKNKLFASYISVPVMLNVNTTPGRKGLSFSAGVSAGYLVGSRNKQISGERGKDKTKGDFDLEKFRLAYIGELGLGPVRLFGSYSTTFLHEKGLKQYPYSFGVRFSNW
jgi:hypothetical protein